MWSYNILIGVLTLSGFVLYSTKAQDDYGGYRITNIYSPSKYVLGLSLTEGIFSGTNDTFSGTVIITFQVTNSTNKIELHDKAMYSSVSLSLVSTSTAVTVSSYDTYNSTTEIRTIEVAENLVAGMDYSLTISYTGVLRNAHSSVMRGFYVATYKNSAGSTEYMVTTQFEPTHARHAFPCFDEPHLKAVFQLSITYPKVYKALYNTDQSLNETVDDTYHKTTFKESPKMSTYLNAFIVSNFSCSEGTDIAINVPLQVCSRQEEAQDRAFALEVSTPIMQSLENITGIKYGTSIAKMDEIALPDFESGAMENWGLVTYRETGLLWSPENSSNSYKKGISLVVAHEFTHMWFGNLVTCDWWDYIFLNEGFARLYQYFALTPVSQFSDWQLDKHFIVEQVHTALVADSGNSDAITSRASSQTEISAKFSTINYNKAACVLRMVENFMGSANFVNGLRSYLETYAYKSTVPENLWTSLAQYATGVLPSNVTLNGTLANWTNQPGYPLVTVTVSGNDVILSQKRFRLNGSTGTTQWYVPITYTLSNDTGTFSNKAVKAWLAPGKNLTLKNVLNESSWIILNNQQSSFYRIAYDSEIWSKIKSTLASNHTSIDVMNRAQIVDDTYNLARAGHITYWEALDVFTYLKNEVEYYPWYAAIVGMNHLFQRIGYESSEGQRAMAHFLAHLELVYATVPFGSLNAEDQVYTMKQMVILTRACRFGKADCVSQAKELFAKYKNGTSVPKNLRSIVYCNALRHSDDITTDFNFLWSKYQETTLATELVTMLGAFGCTQNSTLLKWFLKQTINSTSGIRTHDFASAWFSVYSNGGKIGAVAAMEFILEEYSALTSYFSKVESLISNIANQFYSEDQLYTLRNIINSTTVSSTHKTAATTALTNAVSNINWASALRSNVTSFLDEFEKSAAFSFGNSVLLILGGLLVQILLHR